MNNEAIVDKALKNCILPKEPEPGGYKMIIDGRVIEFLEKRVTHPIQRHFGYSNFILARWLIILLLVTFFIFAIGLIPISSDGYEFLFGIHDNLLGRIGVGTFWCCGIYAIFYDIPKKERESQQSDTPTMNKRKIMAPWQLLRIQYLISVPMFSAQLILAYDALANLASSLLGLVIYLFGMGTALYLLSLDPLPRSKEEIKIPANVQVIKA